MTNSHKTRNNGFERPYNPMQMATWILFPMAIMQFLIFHTPNLPPAAAVIVTLLFLSLSFSALYYGFKSCITDPIDPLIKMTNNNNNNNNNNNRRNDDTTQVEGGAEMTPIPVPFLYKMLFPSSITSSTPSPSSPLDEDNTKFCWVCQCRVSSHSMHCKFCDKCVSRFDHHCQWLNTCIGRNNYPFFFLTVVFTFLFLVVSVVVGIALTAVYFSSHSSMEVKVMKGEAWIVVVICFWVFHLGCAGMVGQLLVFHINLRRENITTYEYIVRDNAKRRELEKLKLETETKRARLLREARDSNDKCQEITLSMGRFCKFCDPVRIAQKEEKHHVAGNTNAADGSQDIQINQTNNKRDDIHLLKSFEETNHAQLKRDYTAALIDADADAGADAGADADADTNSHDKQHMTHNTPNQEHNIALHAQHAPSENNQITNNNNASRITTHHQDRNENNVQNGTSEEDETRITTLDENNNNTKNTPHCDVVVSLSSASTSSDDDNNNTTTDDNSSSHHGIKINQIHSLDVVAAEGGRLIGTLEGPIDFNDESKDGNVI